MLVMYLTLIDSPTDREIFAQLYTEHRQSMFYFANLILRDNDLAEDAVHEAFVRVAKNINNFDFTKDATNLLLTIVKNTALTMKAKRDREIYTYDSVGVNFSNLSYSIEEHYDSHSELVKILQIVDSMPSEYGAVFRLRYLHDMKYDQIASALDITVSAAKKRIQRIREYVSRVLARGDSDGSI